MLSNINLRIHIGIAYYWYMLSKRNHRKAFKMIMVYTDIKNYYQALYKIRYIEFINDRRDSHHTTFNWSYNYQAILNPGDHTCTFYLANFKYFCGFYSPQIVKNESCMILVCYGRMML